MTERIDKTDSEWRNELTREQFYVLRQQGTERERRHEPRLLVQVECLAAGAVAQPAVSAVQRQQQHDHQTQRGREQVRGMEIVVRDVDLPGPQATLVVHGFTDRCRSPGAPAPAHMPAFSTPAEAQRTICRGGRTAASPAAARGAARDADAVAGTAAC